MDGKEWIDSIIQKTPSEDDFQLSGTVSVTGANFEVNVVLKAPGGKTLWSGHTGATMRSISMDLHGSRIDFHRLPSISIDFYRHQA